MAIDKNFSDNIRYLYYFILHLKCVQIKPNFIPSIWIKLHLSLER